MVGMFMVCKEISKPFLNAMLIGLSILTHLKEVALKIVTLCINLVKFDIYWQDFAIHPSI